MVGISDVQGMGKPLGFKGKGQEGKGQGKDFMTLRKPLPVTIFLLFICARLPHVGLSFHSILIPPL